MGSPLAQITKQHFQYIQQRTNGEDPFLKELKEAARKVDIPPIWISPEQASCMQILLKLAKAKTVVEVGGLAGYSAIQMARALPDDGKVISIEICPRRCDFIRQWVDKSDVAGKVEVKQGAGIEVLPSLPDLSADAAFLDADKESYPQYLKECLRIVKSGGLIMADNAFAFGQLFDENPEDAEVEEIRAFNEIMAKENSLQSVIVPLGDGFWVGVKK